MAFSVKKTWIEREHFLSALITAWEGEGYVFGVDKYLHLQQVLQHLPDTLELAGLKTFIAPLLVDDPQKQTDFYRIFDQTLELCSTRYQNHGKLVRAVQRKEALDRLKKPFKMVANQAGYFWSNLSSTWKNIFKWAIFPLMLFGFFGAGFLYFSNRTLVTGVENHQEIFVPVNLKDSNLQTLCLKVSNEKNRRFDRIGIRSKPPTVVLFHARLESGFICLDYKAVKPGRDITELEACLSGGDCIRFSVIFRTGIYEKTPPLHSGNGDLGLIPTITPSRKPFSTKEKSDSSLATPEIQPLDTADAFLEASRFSENPGRFVSKISSPWRFGTGHTYFSTFKGVLVALFASILVLFGVWFRYRRQRFTIQHHSGNNPPYSWTIRIPFIGNVPMGERFYSANTEMRRRSLGENRKLDLPLTVKSTVEKAGMIDFKYRFQFRNKEYLFLLDFRSPQNHQAKIFDLILRTLQENETQIECFYFDGDIRHCWNERFPQGISLLDMTHKFNEHQLIIVSAGAGLLDSNYEWLPWTNLLETWRQKAILSLTPASAWDRTENALASKFRILPASPLGLASLVEHLEAIEPKNYLLWKEIADENLDPVSIPENLDPDALMGMLEAAVGADKDGQPDNQMLCWVASCALPPVLFWDWTLYAGQLLSHPDAPLLSLENLFKIIRLSWFVEGRISEYNRSILLAWLAEKHPHLEFRMRQEWQKILSLEDNLPPVGSIAWFGHRVQVILNELLQNPGRQKSRRLEMELDRLLMSVDRKDALLIKYQDQRKSPLDRFISDRFRKFIQEKQVISWRWRDWTWQLPLTGLFFLASLFIHYTEPVRFFAFEDYVSAVAFSPDNQTFLVANGYGSLALCRTTGEWIQGINDSREMILSGNFSTDGETILTGSMDGVLKYWDKSGAPVFSFHAGNDLATSFRFSPDYSKVLIGYYNGTAKLWDVFNKTVLHIYSGHSDAVKDVDISPSGKYVVTCSRDKTARIWTLEGKLVVTLTGHSGTVNTVRFSPDGTKVLTGGREGLAMLWASSGNRLATFKGHAGELFDVAFMPDGASVITASGDKTARLWSINGDHLRTFEGHRDEVHSLDISQDGARLLTGSYDKTARIWFLK